MVYATSPNNQQAEQEKQRQFMERTRDIQKHRIEMMAEKERQQREEQQANQDTLKQKRAHDLKVSFLPCLSMLPSPASVLQFHQAQQEKAQRAHQEATELQQFLLRQMAEREEEKAMERKEEMKDNMHNRQFMKVYTYTFTPAHAHLHVHVHPSEEQSSLIQACVY